ncbi:hypothetical protein PL75_03275 [Neisseria arctica]|uniref:Phage head morphogenesis domain-containing protein n=1 Tax=Neisseria arctica TaxID=1470200 RepID=A0A0J0YSX7_9NEIS|nr:phage minor head protein [Neisseria arctica]KLT73260.1 hypothetical protein PL75_03275 [Neisseria arctica]UOO87485.1 phage head morphogenesis protein [Neisseria arctica]
MADNLNDLSMQSAIRLEGVKEYLSADMRERLLSMREQVKRVLDVDDELSDMTRKELQDVLDELDAVLLSAFAVATDGLKKNLTDLSLILADHEVAALGALGVNVKQPSGLVIQTLLKSRPLSVEGMTTEPLLEPFINGFSANQRMRISAAIKQGIAQGQTNAQIRQRIIGTKKANYNDGIVGASFRSADAIVRTSVQHVSSMVRQAMAEENRDIVEGVQIVATLDGRTSSLCRSLDAKIYPLDKGPRPPFHVNCRTTTALVLKKEYRGREIVGTRASMGGQVSDGLTYYDWLKTQSAAFQDEVLGVQRGKLFRDGGISAARFAELQLDKKFRPRTLDELRELIPTAFNKAGL